MADADDLDIHEHRLTTLFKVCLFEGRVTVILNKAVPLNYDLVTHANKAWSIIHGIVQYPEKRKGLRDVNGEPYNPDGEDI